MVQFQLKKLYIGLIFLFLSISVYSQGPPRLRFTQLPQSDSIGSLLLTNSQKNLEFTNNLRYLNNVFSVVGGANFDDNTLYVDATNNRVGIGTSSPSVKLHIEGGNIFAKKGSSSILFDEYNNGSILWMDGSDGDVTGGDYWGVYAQSSTLWGVNYAGGTNILNITSTGNVGIGTTNPGYKLSVEGTANGINISGTEAFLRWNSGDMQIKNEGSYKMGFYTYNTTAAALVNRMVIDTDGNVGIGTTTPSAKLDVNGTGRFSNTLTASSTAGGTSAIFQNTGAQNSNGIELRGGTAGTSVNWKIEKDNTVGNAFQITPSTTNGGTTYTTPSLTIASTGAATFSGNVGIGQLNPNAPLHVVGRAIASNFVVGPYSSLNDATGIANTLQFGNYATASFIDQNSADAYVYKASSSVSGMAPQTLMFQTRSDVDGGGFAFVSGNTPTAKMYIEGSSGNVGIGETSPSAKLHVVGASGAINGTGMTYLNNTDDAFSLVVNNAGNSDQNDRGVFEARVGTNSVFRINNSGNVGIGNTGSNAKLEVTATSGEVFRADANFGAYRIVANQTGVNMNGNVGIGTSTPTGKLHIVGNTPSPEYRGFIYTNNSSATLTNESLFQAVTTGWTTTNSPIFLFRDDRSDQQTTQRIFEVQGARSGVGTILTTLANGNVGIGTTNPLSKLHVASGSISIDADQAIRKAGDNYIIGYSSTLPGITMGSGTATDMVAINAGGQERFRITTTGNVGIGTTSPSYKLHVNGSVAGVGAYNNLSDVNYKKNINDLELGLDIVKQLRPITYNWINEEYGTRTNIGFIAQEVESVLPNIVTTADDNVKSMATTDLIPILTKAIQEQQTIIETQEQKIQELETLLQTLVSRIETLENK